MIDGEGGEGAAGAAEIVGGEGGEGGGGGGDVTPREWMNTLPDDLKADATLARYEDIPALAKAHVEAHKVAKGKLVVPGADATPEQWGEVFDKLGRPESSDKYELVMPELSVDANDEARAARDAAYQPFRDLAYKIGLNGEQAKALSEFELERQNAFHAQGDAEVTALKDELGQDYEPKRAAAQKAFAAVFGDDDEAALLAQELDRKVGSGRLIKGMMRLAEKIGEPGIVHSDDVPGFGDVKDAEGKLRELAKDQSWRDKFEAGDATVVAQEKRLRELAVQQALRAAGGRQR